MKKICRLRIISFCVFRYHNAKKRFKVFRLRSPSALEPQISGAVVVVISLLCRRLLENPVIIPVILVGISAVLRHLRAVPLHGVITVNNRSARIVVGNSQLYIKNSAPQD